MGVLRVNHPDIIEFISCKAEPGALSNFNISVALTDDFMKSVMKNSDFDLVFNNKVHKTLKARDLFKAIAKHAWINGDPGIIFIDRINRFNPTPNLGRITSTNPCGEVPLLANESCNLGSINLSHMLNGKNIDYDKN
jgi:ribonucleoside-diphosphate reductase alpha chain